MFLLSTYWCLSIVLDVFSLSYNNILEQLYNTIFMSKMSINCSHCIKHDVKKGVPKPTGHEAPFIYQPTFAQHTYLYTAQHILGQGNFEVSNFQMYL